jgi:PhoH-like ATPase
MAKKIFVLDTNVILHDFNCINSFQDNDIAVPITVLEEIDRFKRGHDLIHYNAREFTRILDTLSGDQLVKNGVSLPKGDSTIRIVTNHQHEPEVTKVFTEDKADHRILSVAMFLTKTAKNEQVILVSKDMNLRLKAKSLGVISQDYFTDKVPDVDSLQTKKRTIKILRLKTLRLFVNQRACFPLKMQGLSQ